MKKIYKFLIKTLLCIIVFLSLAILCKKNSIYKEKINYELYQNHLSFSYFRNLYNQYLGGILPLDNIINRKKTNNIEAVAAEKLNYTNISPYLEGIVLEVPNNYSIPNQEEGVVVFIGEKEGYGNVVIIEGLNDIDTWYGNLCNISIKPYDYIEKGKYIAESCDNHLYIVYTKDNKYLNYQDYLS